jgi:hypothetical protein
MALPFDDHPSTKLKAKGNTTVIAFIRGVRKLVNLWLNRYGALTGVELLAIGLQGPFVVDIDYIALPCLTIAFDWECDINFQVFGGQHANSCRGQKWERKKDIPHGVN